MASSPERVQAGIRQRDIDRFISRFIQAYEQGAIQEFVALFGDRAVTNDGIGKAIVYSSYDELFRTSEDRVLIVENLLWSGDRGGVANLSFLARLTIDRGLFSPTDEYAGDVRMRLLLDDGQLLITEFIHQVEEK